MIFLDRDGVINRDSPDYIKSWAEYHFLPRSLAALRELNQAGYTVILITNQSAVNRGIVTLEVLAEMHRRLCHTVANSGGAIADIFYCPHTPAQQCRCRKPKPGLIQAACQKYTLNPAATVMVGDSAKDIQCARRAGCQQAVMVQTGAYRHQRALLKQQGVLPDHIAVDLYAAVQWIQTRPSGSIHGA